MNPFGFTFVIAVLIFPNFSIGQVKGRTTAERVIAYWDPKMSIEQRQYRLWMDSLSVFLGSLGDKATLESVSSIDRSLTILRAARDRINATLKRHLRIWERYGPELQATIKDPSRLSRFKRKWNSSIEAVTIVYTYDSQAIGHVISYMQFLRNNHSKFYFVDGEMQSDDQDFIESLANYVSKLDNPEAETEQQQKRNQAVLDYAEALDIAKGIK